MPLTFDELDAIHDSQYRSGLRRAPRLATLAAFINAHFPMLHAEVTPTGYCNTDRHDGRFRIPGKGRHGNLLTVTAKGAVTLTNFIMRSLKDHRKTGEEVYTHNAAETYRTNYDVINWILRAKKDLLDKGES
jgi:hypothetical protein